MARGIRLRRRLLIAPFWYWFLFFILGPLVILFLNSVAIRDPYGNVVPAFVLDSYRMLMDPLYAKVMGLTLFFALGNTVGTVVLAYPLALFIARLRGPARMWLMTLVLIPFWTSFLVRILAFMDLLRAKPFGLDWIYTGQGVLGAMIYNYLPFAVLPLYSSMEKIEPAVFEAARDLGASRLQVFTKILLPLTKPALITAAMFVFIPSLGEFLIPDLVGGGHFYLLGSFLKNQFETARNWPFGASAIMVLVGATFVLLAVANFLGADEEEVSSTSRLNEQEGEVGIVAELPKEADVSP